jgi:hypothetical protein
MVILNHTTESLTAHDRIRDRNDLFVWLEDLTAQNAVAVTADAVGIVSG